MRTLMVFQAQKIMTMTCEGAEQVEMVINSSQVSKNFDSQCFDCF